MGPQEVKLSGNVAPRTKIGFTPLSYPFIYWKKKKIGKGLHASLLHESSNSDYFDLVASPSYKTEV